MTRIISRLPHQNAECSTLLASRIFNHRTFLTRKISSRNSSNWHTNYRRHRITSLIYKHHHHQCHITNHTPTKNAPQVMWRVSHTAATQGAHSRSEIHFVGVLEHISILLDFSQTRTSFFENAICFFTPPPPSSSHESQKHSQQPPQPQPQQQAHTGAEGAVCEEEHAEGAAHVGEATGVCAQGGEWVLGYQERGDYSLLEKALVCV